MSEGAKYDILDFKQVVVAMAHHRLDRLGCLLLGHAQTELSIQFSIFCFGVQAVAREEMGPLLWLVGREVTATSKFKQGRQGKLHG